MAVSTAVKRLGVRWEAIRARTRQIDFPAQGMTLTAFCERHLVDVPPGDVWPVAKAMARKGDLWVGIVGGVEMVFREKPLVVRRTLKTRYPGRAKALAAVLNDAASYCLDHDEAAVPRIVRKLRRAIANGSPLDGLRTAISGLFGADLWAAIERYGLGEVAPEAGTDIEGDGPAPRVLRAIARRGRQGIGKTELLRSVQPLTAKTISNALASLEDQCLIVSAQCIPNGIGRKREVFFLAELGIPMLDRNGAFVIWH